MKIVHILLTHSFAGTERHVVELANAQAAQHEVTVILHRRAAEARPNAFAHRFVPSVKLVRVAGWRFFAVLAARSMLRALAPDVAHAHLSGACRVLQGVQGLCLRVATLHIHYKPPQHRGLDALIAIAPWQLPAIPPVQRAHTAQIDNWTAASPFDPAARQRLRAELGFKPDDFVIGALGRAEASKGWQALIEAFADAAMPHCRLVLVGQGREWTKLRNQASDDVVMPGFVEQPEEWFSAFDAFVSAAKSEPFGLVFLEAMAAGLPILATATQGAKHFQALIGRPLLPIGDVAALSTALKDLAAHRPGRQTYDLGAYTQQEKLSEIEDFYRLELPNSATP